MSRRLSTAEFIEKAKAVHGDRYDYSHVDYVNAKTKIAISCLRHGEFIQTPSDHLSGKGCQACGNEAKSKFRLSTTEEFLSKAKSVHRGRYDYSQVEYVEARKHVLIICQDHGPFEQRPSNHLSGQGCPVCAGKEKTTERFIEEANRIHGDRYDYSRALYEGAHKKIEIVCPLHGAFEQTPTSHLSMNGCPKCAGNVTLGDQEFMTRARTIHGDRYDYSRVKYVNNQTKVTIICPDHGPFRQIPASHLNKAGCPNCAINKKSSTEEFIRKATAIHGDRYDYSSVDYLNATSKVRIICPEHGPFDQTPNNHLNATHSRGCPDCADTGFNPNDRGIVYYIAIKTDTGDTRYKIGITNSTVAKRFYASEMERIRIIKTWQYAIGHEAVAHEAQILRQYAGDKYYGPDILQSGGNTELFTHDVLGLDSE